MENALPIELEPGGAAAEVRVGRAGFCAFLQGGLRGSEIRSGNIAERSGVIEGAPPGGLRSWTGGQCRVARCGGRFCAAAVTQTNEVIQAKEQEESDQNVVAWAHGSGLGGETETADSFAVATE